MWSNFVVTFCITSSKVMFTNVCTLKRIIFPIIALIWFLDNLLNNHSNRKDQ